MTKTSTKSPFRGAKNCQRSTTSQRGASAVELVVVLVISGVLSAMAIPQFFNARRQLRAVAIPREIAARLREVRQLAMSQRQPFTFQYDDSTKYISVIDHGPYVAPATLFADALFPMTATSVTRSTIPLAVGGIPAGEIAYGIPAGVASGATPLPDGATLTSLASNKITITFQPEGTVVDATGMPVTRALFFYDTKADVKTACAVSVIGAGGRIKVWRYSQGTSKYVE